MDNMKKSKISIIVLTVLLMSGCANTPLPTVVEKAPVSTDIKMIEIAGGHKVWTQKMGNNDSIKLLLLHGGPGATHEYFKN